jgi:hypothetical protein
MDKQKITLKLIDGKLKKYSGTLLQFDNFISIDDRRAHQRFNIDVLAIHGKSAYAKVARILDMSVSGILLETDGRLNAGDICIIKMEGRGRVVNIKCVVVWYLLDRRIATLRGDLISIYKAGLKYMNMSEEKMKEIMAFIERHKQNVDKQRDMFALSGLRLHMRFQIETPKKAVLICGQSYRVRNISLGGMLIESEDALEIGKKLSLQISRSDVKSIKVMGRVVSCIAMDESDQAHYNIGIEFLSITETDREKLKEFICLIENMGFIAI